MPEFDVLVAGELNPDLILTEPGLKPEFGQVEILVRSADLTIGSSSAIFACGAARLGLNVAFIGVLGDDIFGDFMMSAMEARGVDMSNVIVDPEQKTGLSVILNRGNDRAILTHLGAIGTLKTEQISDDLLNKTRHIHVASYFLQKNLQPGLLGLFKKASSRQITTSLDVNWDPHGNWSGVANLLPFTNIFFPNEAEAVAITGTGDIDQAIKKLPNYVQISALKLGGDGGAGIRADELQRVPAIPVDVADTVGAGDSFDAGFVFGYLNGWSLERSLKLAVVCGSLSTRAHGGTTSQPTLKEALEAVRTYL